VHVVVHGEVGRRGGGGGDQEEKDGSSGGRHVEGSELAGEWTVE